MKFIKLSQLFFKIKVQKQLYIIYLLAMIIPVIAIGGYMVYHARSLLTKHYMDQAYSDNLRVKSLLLDLTSNIYDRSINLANNKNIISLLSGDADTSSKMALLTAYREITALLEKDSSISSIDIYTYNEELTDGKYFHLISDYKAENDDIKKAVASAAPFWTVKTVPSSNQKDKKVLSLYTRIFLPKIKNYAILSMSVSANHLKNRIENSALKTIIWLNDGLTFYNTGGMIPENIITDLVRKQGVSHIEQPVKKSYNALGYISPLYTSYSSDIFYICSLDYEAYPRMNEITGTYISILILISGTFIYTYSAYFSKRISALREAVHAASLGDYNITDTFTGQDEISQVFTDLNIMLKDILKKEAEAFEARIKVQELANKQHRMEFKMLTSQINPHFLYNTLETIRMRSLKAGNIEVATAIKLLGKSMRYVLENTITDFIPLKKELDYIETYLAIQKLRFYDKVNYKLEFPEEASLSEYQILPLLLQPIVENAILHGLKEIEENGKIIIRIKTSYHKLFISIYDNGCGMNKQELSAMRDNIFNHPKDSSKSIGLANIYQRIKLCYGKDYGLKVHSSTHLGTVVTVSVPNSTKEGGLI